MALELPETMPHRAAVAIAAGAGPHAQTVWDVLDPTWAEIRRRHGAGERLNRRIAGVSERGMRLRWAATIVAAPEGIHSAAPAGAVHAWRAWLRAVGTSAPPAGPALDAPGRIVTTIAPYWWVRTRRLRIQAARAAERDAGRGVLDQPYRHRDRVATPDTARWASCLAEQPVLVGRTVTMRSYSSGIGIADDDAPDGYAPLWFYGADLCGAVLGATLGRLGAEALTVGLRLAACGNWGLGELCCVVDEFCETVQ